MRCEACLREKEAEESGWLLVARTEICCPDCYEPIANNTSQGLEALDFDQQRKDINEVLKKDG